MQIKRDRLIKSCLINILTTSTGIYIKPVFLLCSNNIYFLEKWNFVNLPLSVDATNPINRNTTMLRAIRDLSLHIDRGICNKKKKINVLPNKC